MNIIKRCFTAIVSATMCAMVLVQPFGDNLLTLKPELVSYAVGSENSTAENYADVVMNNYDMYSKLLIPDEEVILPVGRTLGSIIKSEYFFDGIEGLYNDTNGEKFYLCYDNSVDEEAIDYNKLYYNFIQEELAPQYNIASLENFTQVHERYGDDYPVPYENFGIVSADIYDYNNDDYKDLLVVTFLENEEYYDFHLQLYTLNQNKKVEFLDEYIYSCWKKSYRSPDYFKLQRINNRLVINTMECPMELLYSNYVFLQIQNNQFEEISEMLVHFDYGGEDFKINDEIIAKYSEYADSVSYDEYCNKCKEGIQSELDNLNLNGIVNYSNEYKGNINIDFENSAILTHYTENEAIITPNDYTNLRENIHQISENTNQEDVKYDNQEAYYKFIEEMVSEYGVCQTDDEFISGLNRNPNGGLDDYTVKKLITTGVIGYLVDDLNNDGNSELIVTVCKNPSDDIYRNDVYVQIYSYDADTGIIMTDERKINLDHNNMFDGLEFEQCDILKNEKGEKYICFYSQHKFNGTSKNICIYKLDLSNHLEFCSEVIDPGYSGGIGFYFNDSPDKESYRDGETIYEPKVNGGDETFDNEKCRDSILNKLSQYGLNINVRNAENCSQSARIYIDLIDSYASVSKTIITLYANENHFISDDKIAYVERSDPGDIIKKYLDKDNNENQDKTYGDYTYFINENNEIVITKYTGSEENVEIPSEIYGKKVTTISGIEGSADLEYQRIGAFEGNSAIKSVVIPDTVTKIEMNSFRACDNLQNVTISENIQTIEQNAFNDCNLSYIYLPESISDIGDCAFGYSGGSVIDGFVIYGFIGTSAETYANDNDILFIARNSDDTIIQPLALTLDYEKISDYSTLPNDDTVDLMKYPVYKVTAKVKNIDLKTANNVEVKINPSAEMTLINGSEIQTVETINSNEEVTFTWTLKIDTTKSYSTMCDVIAKADNSVESQSYLTITFDSSVMEKDNRFDFTRDTWWFTNSSNYFDKGYYIKDEYLTYLYSNLPNTSIQNVKDYLNSKWTGSCYGMSVVAILDKLDILDVTDYDTNATCVHDADAPKDNENIYSLINAYHVSQKLPEIQNILSEPGQLNTHECLVKLTDAVKNVKSGGSPVLFNLFWFKDEMFIGDEDYNISGHTMVAYDIEYLNKPAMIKNRITEQDEPYTIKISIYDCATSGKKPIYMYVNSDLTHWIIPVLCGSNGLKYWNNALGVWQDKENDGDFYDKLFEAIEGRNKDRVIVEDYAQDIREEDSRPIEGGRYNTLYYAGESWFDIIIDPSVMDCFNWDNFTSNYQAILTANTKTNLLIKWNNNIYKFLVDKLVDGVYNNGEEITTFFSNAAAEDANGIAKANINYVLPSLTGEYIVSDPDGKPTDIDYSLTYENSMVSVEASAAKEVTFNVDSVEIQADNSDYEVALTFNEGYYDMPWYTISASGDETNEVSMSKTDEGIVLSSDNMENVKISANNTDETIELTFTADTENVLISNNENNLEVYEDINSDGIYETLVSTTAFNNEVDSDETNVTQDNNTNNLPTSPENNDNLKSDINTKSISTNSAPETGDNVIKIISTLLLAVTAMIVFRKRK